MSDALVGTVEPPVRGKSFVAQQAAQTIAETIGYGGTVTEADLLSLFGIVYPSSGTRKQMERPRLEFAALMERTALVLLKTHKMALDSKGGGRWVIVPPQAQTDHATKVARDAIARGLGKAVAIAQNINRAVLTPAEERRATDNAARLAGLRMFAEKATRDKALPSGSKP